MTVTVETKPQKRTIKVLFNGTQKFEFFHLPFPPITFDLYPNGDGMFFLIVYHKNIKLMPFNYNYVGETIMCLNCDNDINDISHYINHFWLSTFQMPDVPLFKKGLKKWKTLVNPTWDEINPMFTYPGIL